MGAYLSLEEHGGETSSDSAVSNRAEPRWDLAFLGILGYLIVEYTRLPAMYPVLQVFNLGKVAVAAAALGLLFAHRTSVRKPTVVRLIDIALCMFVLASFLSTCFAPYQGRAWDGLLQTLIWAAIYFLIGRIVNTPWRFRIFIFVFLLLNLKLAQHSIRYFHRALSAYSEMVVVTQGAGAGSTGFFSNSADFGVAMCVVWAIATTLLLAKMKTRWRLALLVASATTLVAIFICGSRGAVVGAACIALAAWVRSPKKLVSGVIMGLLIVAAFLFVLPTASLERFHSAENPEQDKTAHQRLMLWKEGLRMFEDHPLLGVGLANYPPVRKDRYIDPEDTNTHESVPHSLYIQAIAELGLAGVFPLIALWILLLAVNAKTRKRLLALSKDNRRSYEYCLAVGLDLAFVGYMTSGAFVAVLYYPHLWVLLGLSVGLYTTTVQTEPSPSAFTAEDSPVQLTAATPWEGR